MRTNVRVAFGICTVLVAAACSNRGADRVLGSDPREIVDATVGEIRTLEVGTRARMNGVALTAWNAFGDSSLHVRDATGSIRATHVASVTVSEGDSVQVTGTIALNQGQRTLDVAVASVLASVGAPVAVSTTTGSASAAGGGNNDAALVIVNDAVISTAAPSGSDFLLTVDDGSGPVGVLIEAALGATVTGLVPGVTLNVRGVLVPTNTGEWLIKPRRNADLVIATPLVTIQQLRSLPVSSDVVISGVALNDLGVFSDQSLHVRDGTGSLRTTNLTGPAIFHGDSVVLRGTVGTQFGQRILTQVIVTRIQNVGPPQQTVVTSALAATALGGSLDAAGVVVSRATITNRMLGGTGIVLTVNDGSGALTVEIDIATGIPTDSYQPGAVVDFAGVLVPTGGGSWKLKPRVATDMTVVLPVLSIQAARTRPVGDTVVVVGVALNNVTAFGDGSLHVADTSSASAAIRVFPFNATSIFAGDSLRIRGVIGSRNGQPTIENATSTFVTSVTVPFPEPLTTAIAAQALAGRFDADIISVANAVITSTATVGGDFIMTVNDNTGLLQVVLDQDIAFNLGTYIVGLSVDAVGLLVPTGAGTWQLKPRGDSDISPNP